MRAVVYRTVGEWSVEDVRAPEPAAGEVRVRITAAGVCGTDEHLLHGTFLAEFPLIPGHEMLGEVDAVGDGVAGLSVGDRVAVDNATACGVCASCRRGRPLFCANF